MLALQTLQFKLLSHSRHFSRVLPQIVLSVYNTCVNADVKQMIGLRFILNIAITDQFKKGHDHPEIGLGHHQKNGIDVLAFVYVIRHLTV